MTIKIHGVPYSTCTSRVLATLFEKDVTDFEIVPVDLSKGEHKKPEFLALQPFGQIPVLQEDGLTLFESRAIAKYICVTREGQGYALYGPTKLGRALVEQWLEVESQSYNTAIAPLVYELVFTKLFGGQTDQAAADKHLEKLGKVLDIYEKQLTNHKYLAGDFFSLADLSHLPYTHYLINVAGVTEPFDSRPHVKAWWTDISARPSWVKTLELAQAHKA